MRNGLLSTIELAEILDVNPNTVRRWTDEKAIPAHCVMWTGRDRPVAHYKIEQLLKEGVLTTARIVAHHLKRGVEALAAAA